MPKSRQMQIWKYERFFWGQIEEPLPIEMTEEQVRLYLDNTHFGGNWDSSSLKRGPKKKVPLKWYEEKYERALPYMKLTPSL